LDLSHAVDPFADASTTTPHLYFRLHGIGGWKYVFADADYKWLAARVHKSTADGSDAYVFFNNVNMVADAQRFEQVLSNLPTKKK